MITPTVLEQGCFYHIYNRGNNSEILFKEHENYTYFLKLIKKYIVPVADIYAYCLLNNHFHLLIRVREDLEEGQKVNQMFSNLFNAYSKAFNKRYNRTGKLFEEKFKKKKIEDEFYLTEVISYIHSNPQKHKITKDFRLYPHSSYPGLLSKKPTDLKRTEVMEWFRGETFFVNYHDNKYQSLID